MVEFHVGTVRQRKRRLRAILPRGVESRLRYVQHVRGRGVDLFRAVYRREA